MIKKTYTIKGMHCASCVTLIQNKIQKIDGVVSCEVLLASNKANIVFEDGEIGLDILNATIKASLNIPAPNTRAISVSRTKPNMREKNVMLPTLASALSRFIDF